jgi:hypothetical protein
MTLGFILVPDGAVHPAVVCSGHYIALHRGARRGGLQAWRERRSSLQVPEVLIEASANIVAKAESVGVIAIRRPLVCGWGTASPIIGQEGAFYMRATLFSCMWRRGEQCHGVDDRPGESCSSRGVVVHPVLVQERLRGWRCRGCPAGRCPRAGSRVPSTGVRTRHSGRHGGVPSPCVPTASGVSSQCPAWRCSGGDRRTGLTATGKTAPAGLTSRRSPV